MRKTKVAFIILILFGLISIYYQYRPLSLIDFPVETVYCNTSRSNTSIMKFSFENSSKRKIFFMETSGKHTLNARQSCAVESAAVQNPEMIVVVFFITKLIDIECKEMSTLTKIANIRFEYLDLNAFFNCTSLLSWYNNRVWKRSYYQISHMSDALRFLILWKFGGIYSDLDVIVIKSLNGLRNCAGKESDWIVAPGVMAFDKGHEFVEECLQEFSTSYRPNHWGWNGPHLITRVLEKSCGLKIFLNPKYSCKNVTILPINSFYAVSFRVWQDFFNVSKTEQIMSKVISSSYLVHTWNRLSKKVPVVIGSGQTYDILAKKYCPTIYSKQNVSF